MGVISLLWGLVSLLWAGLAFIPLLGWGNWFMLPFAACGFVFAGITAAVVGEPGKGRAKTGLMLCVVAIVVGVARLIIGGGVI